MASIDKVYASEKNETSQNFQTSLKMLTEGTLTCKLRTQVNAKFVTYNIEPKVNFFVRPYLATMTRTR